VDVAKKLDGTNYNFADATNMNPKVIKPTETLDELVKAKDPRTKGVVRAMTATAQGDEVADVKSIKRGDIVQYWYYKDEATPNGTKKVRVGHTAIVLGGFVNSRCTLIGSNQGVVKEFTTTLNDADRVYAVRPK
jgi:hypothetical protein